jgi:hypothetical protein
MPLQNRIAPFGAIVALAGRGLMMGNRGILHNVYGVVLPRSSDRVQCDDGASVPRRRIARSLRNCRTEPLSLSTAHRGWFGTTSCSRGLIPTIAAGARER